jgi:hypothetical protein
MKKLLTIITVIAAASLFIPSTVVAHPAKLSKKKAVAVNASDATVEVTNLGDKDDCVFLQIDLQQANPTLAILRILDANGNGLYSEAVRTKTHRRTIKISPEEYNAIEVIYATNGGTTQKRYELNTVTFKHTKLVETKK